MSENEPDQVETRAPPPAPCRQRRWLPESRLLRWVVYSGLAIIALNAVGFALLLYIGNAPEPAVR